MTKQELLRSITFGESIAELEAQKLKDYFLQTEFWRGIRNGSNDIVYGAKGTGKSAIYTSIINDEGNLFDENILIALAENPTGTPAFSNLTSDPPTSELEFIRLWKLYFLIICTDVFRDYDISDEHSSKIREILTDCDLIPAESRLSSFLKSCFDFLKSFRNGNEVSTTAEFDPVSGAYTGQKFSLTFGEPSKSDFEKGLIPIEHIYELLSLSLKKNSIKLWIVIDRLDVAFAESEELETNALRALFKAYLDLAKFSDIKIKIFLRDDIWKRITQEGFREASHITRFQNLSWTRESILNVITRRILDNPNIVEFYNLNVDEILSDISEQEKLFYRLFPSQIDIGKRRPKTLEWILSRTKDGKSINAPREVIQLFTHARSIELKKQDNGINEISGENILSKQSIKDAVSNVSEQRMQQTIYAEYPSMKQRIEALRGDKAEHNLNTLSAKWQITEEEALKIAKALDNIGFFESGGDLRNPRFKIPFLYRPYLDILQGSATAE